MSVSSQRPKPRRITGSGAGLQRLRCLTELSIAALIAGALALSALLWLMIYAVI